MTTSASTPPAPASEPSSGSRGRRWGMWVLLVLTCLSLVLATVSVWTHRTLLDGDTWVSTVTGPIIRDPEVVDELSANLTDRIFDGLQVQQRLESVLPAPLQPLAGVLVGNIQLRVQTKIHDVLSTPQAQRAWDQASLVAHDQIVKILRGESTAITTDNGTIYLDLRVLLQTALQALQTAGVIPASVTIPDFSSFETPQAVEQWLETNLGIPPGTDLALVPLGSSAGLEKAQTWFQIFDAAVIVLVVLTIVLGVLTILVAYDRKRAGVELAIGIAVSLLIAYIAVGAIRDWLVDQLAGGTLAAAGRATITAAITDLASLVGVLVGIAVVAAVVIYLLSDPRWLRRLPGSRYGAWIADNMGAMRLTGILVPIGLLLLLPRGPVLLFAIVALAITYQVLLSGIARDVAALGVTGAGSGPAGEGPAPAT